MHFFQRLFQKYFKNRAVGFTNSSEIQSKHTVFEILRARKQTCRPPAVRLTVASPIYNSKFQLQLNKVVQTQGREAFTARRQKIYFSSTCHVDSVTEHNSFSQFIEALPDNSAATDTASVVSVRHYLWQRHKALHHCTTTSIGPVPWPQKAVVSCTDWRIEWQYFQTWTKFKVLSCLWVVYPWQSLR